MKKVTRDFPTLLACAMIADDHDQFAQFFEGLSEPECTVFTEGFAIIVFEILKAGMEIAPQRCLVHIKPLSKPGFSGKLNHQPPAVAVTPSPAAVPAEIADRSTSTG